MQDTSSPRGFFIDLPNLVSDEQTSTKPKRYYFAQPIRYLPFFLGYQSYPKFYKEQTQAGRLCHSATLSLKRYVGLARIQCITACKVLLGAKSLSGIKHPNQPVSDVMVGVPGRSKGCKGCRRRKKACSLDRPICKLCQKLKEDCSYDRDTVFISVGTSTWKRATYCAEKTHKSKPKSLIVAPRPDPLPFLAGTLTQVAFREQLLSKYLEVSNQKTRPTLASWLSIVPSLSGPNKALETSAYAICTSRIGQLYNDPVLKRESLRLYTLGVRQLHLSLRDPVKIYDDEILGACVALALYEIIDGDRAAYSKHADGAAHLIKLRGPNRHMTGLGHRIFLGYRFMGTLRAMEKKESTFLAQPDWIELPWSITPKSGFDRLLDIVVNAPELIRRGDQIAKTPIHLQFEMCSGLFKDCSKLYGRIQEFHTNLAEKADRPLYWPMLSEGSAMLRYDFADVDTAAILVMIWAYSLMIKSGLRVMSGLLKHFQSIDMGSRDDKFELEDGEDLAELAQNILLSVEFCIERSTIEVRSPIIMAPLAIVIDVLKNWPEYHEQYHSARETLFGISKLGFKMVWPPVGEE